MTEGRTFSVGDVCGRFEVRSALEREDAVELYRAVDVIGGGAVTLECSRWAAAQVDVDIERLLRRAAAWRALAGEDVIRVVDGGTTADGTAWLAHEAVPSDGVRARIEVSGAMPPPLAVRIAQAVAERLDVLLGSGFMPPWITPDAVRMRDDGSVVLWLVRLSEPTASASAPEVLSGHAPDARALVYCVALLIYEMLTGEHPFARHVRGESDAEHAMVHAQRHREPPNLSERVPGLAPGLVAAVHAGLAKERAKRPPTLRALAIELGRLREHVVAQPGELPTGTRPRGALRIAASCVSSSPSPTRARPVRQAVRWGAALGIGAAVLLEIARRWLD